MSETTSDDESAVKLHVTGVGGGALAKADTSTQLAERRIRSHGHGVRPPYNPDRLASFLELNETHATAVRKKARYEVGFGFSLVPHRDVDEEEADDAERDVVRHFWRSRTSRWQTGPHQSAEPTSAEEVLELARQDYHSIGWAAIEILVNAEGKPVGLAHVPANTVRVRKPQSSFDQPRHPEGGQFISPDNAEFASRGYVQIRKGKRRYFGEAGDRYRGLDITIDESGDGAPSVRYSNDPEDEREPIFVDQETGEVAVGSAEMLDNRPANELIFVRNPSPLEQDYGVPDWVSAIRTITADEAAKDYNRDFFDNDTVPRMVIKVTGGELSEESKRDLRQMLNGLRAENHRAVILEVEQFVEDNPLEAEDGSDVEIEIDPLGQGISEEMDFKAFREKNEHEIAKVHEVPPIKIGVTDTSNRSNSDVQDREFALEVIQPEQHKFAERLYQILHQQAFGVLDWTIEFELRGADQPKEEAQMTEQRVRSMRLAGVATVNQVLEELGLPLRDDEYGDMPLAEFEAEFTGGGGGGDEEAALERNVAEPPAENKIGEREWDAVRPELVSKDPVEQMQFDSSNLDEGLFDFEENELFLSFHRDEGPNSLYAYVDVPTSEWASLVGAASHGSYHYYNIRLEYPYIEITNFHDRLPEGPTPDPENIPEGVPSPAD